MYPELWISCDSHVKYTLVALRGTLLSHYTALQDLAVCSICLTNRPRQTQDRSGQARLLLYTPTTACICRGAIDVRTQKH